MSEIVLANIHRDDLAARMDSFFAHVDRAVAENNPVCRNRAECCRFGSYGHKLYVTSLELIYFVRHASAVWRQPVGQPTCPYHVDRICTARSFRPLGCRIFFCDPESQDWQGAEYERRLLELRQIGADFGVDYRYVEWLSAITDLTEAFHAKKLGPAGIDAPSTGMIE